MTDPTPDQPLNEETLHRRDKARERAEAREDRADRIRLLTVIGVLLIIVLTSILLVIELSREKHKAVSSQRVEQRTQAQIYYLSDTVLAKICSTKPVQPKMKDLCEQAARAKSEAVKKLSPPPLPARQGEPGPGPTMAQVLAGLRTICSATPAVCQGPEGKAGKSATMAMVLAAQQEICSTTTVCQGPRGEKGDTGKQGEPGKDGISVTGVSCVLRGPSPTRLTITIRLSNGTTETASCTAR